MSDAERLAVRIGAWAMDLDEGDCIIGASQDMREAAALIRALSARITKLEEALWLISYTSAGSKTANSLPHIRKIAQEALETQRPI